MYMRNTYIYKVIKSGNKLTQDYTAISILHNFDCNYSPTQKTSINKKREKMKKQIYALTTLLVMTFSTLTAQTFNENFLGDDFIQYKAAFFKLKDNAILGFSHTFYGDLKYCQKSYDNNVIYPETKYKFNTVKDSLLNRIFLVEDIIGKDGNTFTGGSYFDKPIFLLRDTTTKQAIYYLYDKQYENNFPFLVSQITIDINTLCSKIERRTDDFTNEVTINNPIIEGRKISSMILYKTIKSGKVFYFLSLETYGSTVNVGETGLIILFDDGTKMSKPTIKIDVDTDEKGFKYSAYIPLTETELKSLTKKKIKKFRLYIYDEEVSPGFAEKFTYYVKCIMEKK